MSATQDNGAGDAGVDIEASFKLELGRLSDSVDKLHRELAARKRLMPMDFDAQGSGTYPASGALVISLGQPSVGRLWEVRNWSCGAALWTTPAAGSALIGGTAAYSRQHGGGSATTAAPLTSEVQAAFTTLPNVAQLGTRQLVVSPGENLSVVITGGTAGLVYVAHAYVLDYPLDVELGPLGGTI